MKGKTKEKLFRLVFPGKYKTIKAKIVSINHAKNLNRALQRKEAEIQTLKSKIRRMERGK